MYRLPVAIALLLQACALYPPQRTEQLRYEASVPAHAIPILLDRRDTGPIINVAIGRTRTWLLLDTGASSHILSDDVWAEAFPGLKPVGARASVMDFSGVVRPAVLVREVPVMFTDGWTQPIEVLVGPRFSKNQPFAGALNPHRLHEGGVVVLDFPGRELRWGAPPPAADGEVYDAAAHTMRICQPSVNHGLELVVPVQVAGEWVDLLLDTGAQFTALDEDLPVAQRLLRSARPAGAVGGASGKAMASARVNAPVGFGGVLQLNEVRLIPRRTGPCGEHGVLGMETLRSCRLTFAQGWLMAHCGG